MPAPWGFGNRGEEGIGQDFLDSLISLLGIAIDNEDPGNFAANDPDHGRGPLFPPRLDFLRCRSTLLVGFPQDKGLFVVSPDGGSRKAPVRHSQGLRLSNYSA